MCGLCKAGYAMSSGNCEPCFSNINGSKLAFAIVGRILGAFLLYVFSFKPLFLETEDQVNEELEEQLGTGADNMQVEAAGGHTDDEKTGESQDAALTHITEDVSGGGEIPQLDTLVNDVLDRSKSFVRKV